MKIKFYVFLLSMSVSWMSFAGGFSMPTYTISNANVTNGAAETKVVGRNIFVNITEPTLNATLLGFSFYTYPYNATLSLTGVGTIVGYGSIQNYQVNTQLSATFANGTVVKYNIIVTKDTPPTLGATPDNTEIYGLEVSTVPGAGGLAIPNSKCILSYNKVTCSVPANLSVTSLYFSGYVQSGTTSITGLSNAGLNFVGGYFKSTSLLGINELTTITATAPDGTTRNYSVSFIENKSVYGNDLLNINSYDYNMGLNQATKNISIFKNITNSTVSSLNFQISDEATVSIVGGNVSTVSVDFNNNYPYQFNITLPSADFNIIVTSKDGAAKTYSVNIINQNSEASLSYKAPLDIRYLIIAGNYGQIIDNEIYFNFPNNLLPFIKGTDVYTEYRLNQSGNAGLSIDGVNIENNSTNNAYLDFSLGSNRLEIYTVTAMGNQVLKTYTIKTQVQPKSSIIVGSQNAEGLLTANEITKFSVSLGNLNYIATLVGNTFTVNIPSSSLKTNLDASLNVSSYAMASVPGMLISGGSFNYNFSNPVPCVVYSQDGTSRNYTLVVTNTAPAYNGKNTFGLYYGNIDDIYFENNYIEANYSTTVGNNIRIDLPFGSDITKAKLTFNSSGNSIQIANYGIYEKDISNVLFDFTTPLTVTSVAENGSSSKTYTIALNSILPLNANTEITFNRNINIVKVTKTGDSFNLLYKPGQDLIMCVPSFYFNNGYTNAFVSGIKQYSGYTMVDLTNPVTYKVMAQNGAMKNYTVTAAIFTGNEPVVLNTSKTIMTASAGDAIAVLGGLENEAETSRNNGTIIGTNIYLTVTGNNTGAKFDSYFYGRYDNEFTLKSILVNDFPFNEGIIDYSHPVKITAVAQDNSTLDYFVFVTYTANGIAMKSMYNQSISGFVVPSQVTVSGVALMLNATATSGLAVSFSSSDNTIASITGTSITFLKDGNVTITALQIGNSLYNAVSLSALINVVTVAGLTNVNYELLVKNYELSIVPNPSATGTFNVKGGKSVTIYDIIGNVILSTNESSFTISGKGIFFAKVNTANGVKFVKLIVE